MVHQAASFLACVLRVEDILASLGHQEELLQEQEGTRALASLDIREDNLHQVLQAFLALVHQVEDTLALLGEDTLVLQVDKHQEAYRKVASWG